MLRRTLFLLPFMSRTIFSFACCVFLGCGSESVPTQATPHEASSTPTFVAPLYPPKQEDKQLVLGHQKFMEGCAKCHNERGDKPLEDGRMLNEMEFTESDLAEKVGHRAHDFSPEEQSAILLYVRSLLIHPPVVASTE
jgi:mono/diheme cytochrome c family protein